jgi:hypothetical protein
MVQMLMRVAAGNAQTDRHAGRAPEVVALLSKRLVTLKLTKRSCIP